VKAWSFGGRLRFIALVILVTFIPSQMCLGEVGELRKKSTLAPRAAAERVRGVGADPGVRPKKWISLETVAHAWEWVLQNPKKIEPVIVLLGSIVFAFQFNLIGMSISALLVLGFCSALSFSYAYRGWRNDDNLSLEEHSRLKVVHLSSLAYTAVVGILFVLMYFSFENPKAAIDMIIEVPTRDINGLTAIVFKAAYIAFASMIVFALGGYAGATSYYLWNKYKTRRAIRGIRDAIEIIDVLEQDGVPLTGEPGKSDADSSVLAPKPAIRLFASGYDERDCFGRFAASQ